MHIIPLFSRGIRWVRQAVVPIAIVLFVMVLGVMLYVRSEAVMSQQLRSHLSAIAAIAAMQFDPADIAAVQDVSDMDTVEYRRLMTQLLNIRLVTPGARYAYLVRATNDPDVVRFVADADEFVPDVASDRDGADAEDDEDPALPGEAYDISDMASFREGFLYPAVDHDVTYDKWGALVSGYAPVIGPDGRTVAVFGIDMNADEFSAITLSVFSPVALLFVFAGGAMLAAFSFSVIQRRKFESLRQLEIERTALLDLGTHQLGMPLSTFRWWLEILRDRKKEGKTKEDEEAYDQLQLGVDRMDHIIRSLQDAARLQGDNFSYHAENVDVASFAEEVVASMRSAFELKKQRVRVIRGGDAPLAMIDRKLMAGVLGELLENARGYSPAGSEIVVRVSRVRAMVRIEVIDHGCGIPADQIPRMFQKFTRGKNAYRNKPVGNGLGLYICKGIVERGGGTLSVSSVEGKGTTMILDLPIAS